jgi:hypothetical protein
MKARYLVGLLAVAAVTVAATSQEGVLIRRQLKPNTSETYTMEFNMKQLIDMSAMGMGDQDMTMDSKSKLVVKTGAVDEAKGLADIELQFSEMKMDFGGAAAMAGGMMGEMPTEYAVAAKMDARNIFTEVKPIGRQANQMMMMMMGSAASLQSGLFIPFPERAVQVGESWEVPMPKTPMFGETKLTAKLVGEKVHEGRPVWVISLEGTLPMNVDGEAMTRASGGDDPTGGMMAGMKMTGTIQSRQEALVDKATGQTLQIEGKGTQRQRIEIAQMGMGLDMRGEFTQRLVLVK